MDNKQCVGKIGGLCVEAECPFHCEIPKIENCWYPDRQFSFAQIALLFNGLSKQRIEQIQKAALKKLKKNWILYLIEDNPKRKKDDWIYAK